MIKITDISGLHINNNTPFIILTYNKLENLCNKIGIINNNIIYRIDDIKYSKFIKNKNLKINLKKYIPVGDYCIDINKKINKILLANIDLIITTNKYKYIGSLNNFHFWKGIIKRKNLESRSFGVITTTIKSPPNYNIPVIPKSYLINMDFINNKIICGNEFNILNYKKDGIFIFTRNKLLNINNNSNNNNSNNNNSNNNNSNNNIRFINNNIKKNNLCATFDNNIVFKKCNNSKQQKWKKINNNNFISILDKKKNKCLSFDIYNNPIIKKCKDIIQNIIWKPKKSKSLVLDIFKNPWYLNENIIKDKTLKPAINSPIENTTTKTNSYKIKNSNSDDNFILFILIILLILILIIKYKYYK